MLDSLRQKAQFVRDQLPGDGLFAEKEWRIAPEPFRLPARHVALLDRLGIALHRMLRAKNVLYRQSVEGKAPAYIADWLDRGKPADLVAAQRAGRIKGQIPRVIRPDLILLEDGFALTEIDAVPGGIGLTAWMQEVYSHLGFPLLGGTKGMRTGFDGIFPDGDVVISSEAGDYGPEMKWLVGEDRVKSAEDYTLTDDTPVYRFFECFDWPNLDAIRTSYKPGQAITAPIKPFIEEKLWLALFWLRPLRELWRRELSENTRKLLETVIPQSWVLDPTPLPAHGVIDGLGIHHWKEMRHFSKKERDLVLKVSGFSPLAWGARGVSIGSDMPGPEWQRVVDEALNSFSESPRVLMRFAKGKLFDQKWVDFNNENRLLTQNGRARVSPYYFVQTDDNGNDSVELGGVLVTHCPANKKILHGMTEAIISPAMADE